MLYELSISLRYLFSKKKRLISFMSCISILGITVGVAALIVVLGVMSGFDFELHKRIIGSNPHIVIEKENGLEDYNELCAKINTLEHVKGSFPYIWGQAVLKFRLRAQGVAIRSVDLENKLDRGRLSSHIIKGGVDLSEKGIAIGSELASALGVSVGDEISIIAVSPKGPQAFRVEAIFTSGMYEYDLNLAYARLSSTADLFGMGQKISGIGVETDDFKNVGLVESCLKKYFRYPYYVRTWIDMNRNLFSALKLEKLVMFIILTLIVVVAALNIISTLTVMVTEKTKDIGILKAIGAKRNSILGIFAFQGMFIGFIGAGLGIGSGIGLALLLKKYQFVQLPRDIYYISQIPVKINTCDTVVIAASAFIISLFASLYPAFKASQLEPIEALRHE